MTGLMSQVASVVAPRRGEFVDALVALTEREIRDLNHDDSLRQLLRASIQENVDRLIEDLGRGADPRGAAPPEAAVAYAVELARTSASLASLLRAYRIGQAQFTAHSLEVAAGLGEPVPPAVQIDMVNQIAAYIDHVCEHVTEVHQVEKEKWLGGQQGLRQLWVSRLLADTSGIEVDQSEAGRILGYDLSATHCAAEVWLDGDPGHRSSVGEALNHGVAALQSALGSHARLSVPRSDRELTVWFRISPGLDVATALRGFPESATARIALGGAAAGVQGFRASHRRAGRIRELMQRRQGSAVGTWDDLAAVALLTWSAPDLPDLVDRTLGPLGGDGARLTELRETLRIFLEHNRSFADSAAVLHLHRNTVRYRVQQALDLCGVSPDGHTFDLLAALNAARWR